MNERTSRQEARARRRVAAAYREWRETATGQDLTECLVCTGAPQVPHPCPVTMQDAARLWGVARA